MKDLIERLEKATGPDRELDTEIFRAMGARLPDQYANLPLKLEWDELERCFMMNADFDMRVRFEPSNYTGSIDAALSLVPEGWAAIIYTEINQAELYATGPAAPGARIQTSSGRCGSPATALLIAIFKARAASERDMEAGR